MKKDTEETRKIAEEQREDLEPVFFSSAGEIKQKEDTGMKVSASV